MATLPTGHPSAGKFENHVFSGQRETYDRGCRFPVHTSLNVPISNFVLEIGTRVRVAQTCPLFGRTVLTERAANQNSILDFIEYNIS